MRKVVVIYPNRKIVYMHPTTKDGMFTAYVEDLPIVLTWQHRKTLEEAIGAVILAHPEECGIRLVDSNEEAVKRLGGREWLEAAAQWVIAARACLREGVG